MSGYMDAFGPTTRVRELSFDQLKAEHKQTLSWALRTTSARAGVWEDGLLAYHKKRQGSQDKSKTSGATTCYTIAFSTLRKSKLTRIQ